MVRYAMIGCAFLWSLAVGAQLVVRGRVTDTAGHPLGWANVLLLDGADIIAFTASGEDGKFRLEANPAGGGTFYLKVSYLGYEDYVDSITVGRLPATLSFGVQLRPLPLTLEEARIEYRVPLSVEGDTVVYVVDSFLRGDEQVLKDIIKRLPGLEITPNGEVLFLGKRVTKVLVEGKKFFGGDVRTAIENVPADVVDKVEVLNDYTDVGLMKNVVNQGEIALNVTLKKDRQSFWFGRLEGGGGIPRKYLAAASLYRYHSRHSFNLLGTADNLNGMSLFSLIDFATRERYVIYTGNIPAQVGLRLRGGGNAFTEVFGWPGYLSWQRHGGGGLSANLQTGKHLKWAANGAFSDRRMIQRTRSNVFHLVGDSFRLEQQVDSAIRHRRHYGVVMGGEWKPAPQTQMNLQVAGTRQDLRQDAFVFSRPEGAPWQRSLQSDRRADQRVWGTLDVFRMMGQRHLVALYFRYRNGRGGEVADVAFPSGSPTWAGRFPTVWNDSAIRQRQDARHTGVQGMADYYYLWNDQFHLNFRVGGVRADHAGHTDIASARAATGPYYASVWQWRFRTAFAGVGARRIVGRGTYAASLTAVALDWDGRETHSGALPPAGGYYFLPRLSAVWDLPRGRKLTLRYSTTVEVPDRQELLPVLAYRSYQVLAQGNPALRSERANTLSASFQRIKTGMSAYVNLVWSHHRHAIRPASFYEGIRRYQTFFNLDSPVEKLELHSHFYRSVRRWALSYFIALGGNYTRDWWLSEGRAQRAPWWQAYCNFNIGWEPMASGEVALDGRLTWYQSLKGRQRPGISADVGPELSLGLKNGLRWRVRYSPRPVWGLDGQVRFSPHLEASMEWRKEGTPWYVALEGWNLLGKNVEETFETSDVRILHTRRFLVGPYGVLKAGYRL